MSVRSRVAFNPHSSIQENYYKDEYAKHKGRLQNLRKVTDNMISPRPIRHLNMDHKYSGFGPKQSLDQRISFINENINLAERITKIGRRSRIHGSEVPGKINETSSVISTNRVSKKGASFLPSLGNKFYRGSLNHSSRLKKQGEI
jgi:uncharacterized protein (DUF342 family)